jgi:hypothetical protein
MNFEPSRGLDTPLTTPLENPWFLCRSHTRYLKLFKAALDVFVAEGRTLDGPGDLTHKTKAQTGSYAHRALDGQASSIRPPP